MAIEDILQDGIIQAEVSIVIDKTKTD